MVLANYILPMGITWKGSSKMEDAMGKADISNQMEAIMKDPSKIMKLTVMESMKISKGIDMKECGNEICQMDKVKFAMKMEAGILDNF